MWDAISKLMGLIPALIRELPVGQRRVGVFGILSVVLAWLVVLLYSLYRNH